MVSRREIVLNREELERETGVSARNIRFLVAEGLLPPPEGSGRGAWYTPQHVAMLSAYAAAKAEGVTSMAVTGRRMKEAVARPRLKVAPFDWLSIDVDLHRLREIGVDAASEETRKALEALIEKENGR